MSTIRVGGVEIHYEEHRVIVPDLRGLGRSKRVAPLDRPAVWVDERPGELVDALRGFRARLVDAS